MTVSVLTASIFGRESSLYLAARSVGIQSHPIDAHIVVTRPRGGPAPVHQATSLNQALRAADTEWIAVLDDDNEWMVDHIAALIAASSDAAVVYSWDRDRVIPRHNVNDWPHDKLVAALDAENLFDGGSAIIRRNVLNGVGGFPTEWEGGLLCDGGHYVDSPANYADWETWRRIARAGGVFRCVPAATWIYREDAANRMQDGFN